MLEFKGSIHGSAIVSGLGVSASLLSGVRITCPLFGVNDMDRVRTPDYLVVLNEHSSFAPGRWPYIKATKAQYVFTHMEHRRVPIDRPDRLVTIRLGERSGTDLSDAGIPYTSNSPYVAACLAEYMGAKRIGIIGVDWTDDHCFAKTGKHVLAHMHEQIGLEYDQLRAAMLSRGTELVNLSPISKLNLPYQSLQEFTK